MGIFYCFMVLIMLSVVFFLDITKQIEDRKEVFVCRTVGHIDIYIYI